eukprot:12269853-Alexandrium_andersonii.AAC.1
MSDPTPGDSSLADPPSGGGGKTKTPTTGSICRGRENYVLIQRASPADNLRVLGTCGRADIWK